MLKFAKASLHVTRHLTEREQQTIAVALEHLAQTPVSVQLDELRACFAAMGELISDNEMRALAYELSRARKVKVCRTKQPAT